jgi:superfamily II DNA or RNA helicase
MTTLRITNDYSYLVTDDNALLEKLWKSFRFRQRNYFHTSLYKQRLWDGYVDFFHKTKGCFLTGLVPEIKLALYYLGVKYDIDDQRTFVQFLHEEINDQFLNRWLPEGMNPITLEDYQVALTGMALKHHRGLVKAPTSAGKTYIMLSIMKSLPPGTPILFLCNRKGIVRQNYKEIIKWGFPNVGRFDGTVHEPNIITCATVQSLHAYTSPSKLVANKKKHAILSQKLEVADYPSDKERKKDQAKLKKLTEAIKWGTVIPKLLPKFQALVVDEVHMMMSDTAIKVYKKLTGAAIRIGVSATPFKYERKKKGSKKKELVEGDEVHKFNVKGYFGPMFKIKGIDGVEDGELTTEYLQQRGRLSQSRCVFYPITEPQIPFDIYIDAVTNGIAQNWDFHQKVAALAKSCKGRTLILVERLAHGDTLQQLIPGSLWVQGKDNDETRDYVIDRLQKSTGDIVAIATSGIFSAAINVFIHNLINAAGGKASHDIIQRMGRGLRTADDKEILTYYDFLFKINPYLEDHSHIRLGILEDEGHDITVKEAIDFL